MASKRLLIDTVDIYNYAGEVDDEAVYQKTVFKFCYCPLNCGSDNNMQGKKSKNGGRLYIFDENTIALSPEGEKRTYLPYEEWLGCENKTAYWTLSDKETDYLLKAGFSDRLKIKSFSHKTAGSRRMWHFEVDIV